MTSIIRFFFLALCEKIQPIKVADNGTFCILTFSATNNRFYEESVIYSESALNVDSINMYFGYYLPRIRHYFCHALFAAHIATHSFKLFDSKIYKKKCVCNIYVSICNTWIFVPTIGEILVDLKMCHLLWRSSEVALLGNVPYLSALWTDKLFNFQIILAFCSRCKEEPNGEVGSNRWDIQLRSDDYSINYASEIMFPK